MRIMIAAFVLMMVIAITANKTLNGGSYDTAERTASDNVRLD